MSTYRFQVSGRVQGVGSRAFVVRLADEKGYRGEVWNCRNGSVEGWVQLEGSHGLAEFRELLEKGPGRVDSVIVSPASDDKTLNDFRVSFSR